MLRSCMSGYRNANNTLIKRPSSQKLITDYMLPENNSTVISSSDESDFEPAYHKNMRISNYEE